MASVLAVAVFLTCGCGKKSEDATPVPETKGDQTMTTAVDEAKCAELKKSLSSQPEPLLVPPSKFFEGNDDMGSIGCNLIEHSGVGAFREVLVKLEARPDVESVFLRISELDPGEGCWPFSDSVWLAGTISTEELKEILAPLKPDEVGQGKSFDQAPAFPAEHKGAVLFAWWD